MIKIIKKGNLKKGIKSFKCKICECEFDADETEYIVVFNRNELTYACECPECGYMAGCITGD